MNYKDFIHVCTIFLVSNEKNISKVKNIQSKKVCNLLLNNIGNTSKTTPDPDKVIFNFSGYRLNNHGKSLLFKGLNVAIPLESINYSDYLLHFELLFRDVNSLNFSSFDKECVKGRLRDCIYSAFKQVSKISDKNLPDDEIITLKNLVDNKDLVIQKADKGNTMILNQSYCISRLNRILDETSKFKRLHLEEDKVLTHIIYMEQRIIDLLKSLGNQNEISEKNYNLYPSCSKPGLLYGLGKTQKALEDWIPTFSLILSAIDTSTYKLAKFCDKLLKPITTNEYTIKDFAKEVEEFDPNLIMASSDVKLLFTNISLTETIELFVENLYKN